VPGELHRCLRCGHAAHLVGRAVAECGRCGWPSPLAKETTLIHEKERLAARIEAKVAEIDREIAAAVPRDLRARREALILAQQTLKLEGVL
jgi:predicted  nucleic acid-binding Zn-ribbon protein